LRKRLFEGLIWVERIEGFVGIEGVHGIGCFVRIEKIVRLEDIEEGFL